MLGQLTEATRGSVERTSIVLLHLDVLTTTHTSLTMEPREAFPLLYENPEVVLRRWSRSTGWRSAASARHAWADRSPRGRRYLRWVEERDAD